jgi:deoxyribonucleoside regulator
MKHEDSERGLLIDVARLYYEQQLTQSEIGRRLNTSRSTVSRLLQEARDTGVVQITINYTWERDTLLENELIHHFGIRDAKVLKAYNPPTSETHKGLGHLASRYLNRIADDNVKIGVSYGRSIAATVEQIPPTPRENVTVVQIIGALGSSNPLIEGTDLTRELAHRYSAHYRYLHAPLMVEDARTRDLLANEPTVYETLNLGRHSDIALLGIGSLGSDTSLIWEGYLTEKELMWLRNIGAVGHMCAQFFDRDGQVLEIDLNRRSIGIGLEALPQIGTVIAVAGSRDKAEAIWGALRGHYIDVLITDDEAARQIMRLSRGSAG